ncbi:unnamed protein product (macronuclear) [Paramecium tetraurelia]|uniref:DH domain-containing protein n=1 Tax=Paramecium tetraurelia TaxID=5888 RepID=A0DT23_PARTE|nr:uncharacterized protein GSPATT00019883001 [Paramecium tetraurelia]CAK86190.1 unnamed protein product [Paramecium tetraurelia]|eukprot:XP_001453587.1 hypothetical protein (macronuclear) [Paramecium tetraurelia strain d4-2]
MDKILKKYKLKKPTKQQQIYQALSKLYKQRRYIIREIYQTEKNYVEDLKMICELIVDKYIQQYGIEESKKLFSNIKEIVAVNEWFYDKLTERIQLENQKYQKNYKLKNELKDQFGHENSQLFYFQNQESLLSKFECYYLYCERYSTMKNYILKMKNENENFRQFIMEAEKNPLMKSNQLDDYLIKPIQRLPKYILLLNDLKKNTPTQASNTLFNGLDYIQHPDYENICKLLNVFEKVNDKNNEKIGEFQNLQKMKDVQKQYGSAKLIIDNNKRVFVFQENLEYYVNAYQKKNIQLLCFSDAILLIELEYSLFGPKQKCIAMSEFSLASEFNKINSKQGLLFKITTKQKVFIFIANDNKQLDKIEKLFKITIDKFIQEKKSMLDESGGNEDTTWDQLQIQVRIEGTEEYNQASLQNYTVYIIQIQLKDIGWKIYLRYSQVSAIFSYIKKCDSANNVLKLQKSNWLQSHQNKYLDSLKINIEGFIQSIFQWKNFEQFKKKILIKLGLPTNFNILPRFMGGQNEQKLVRNLSVINENQDSIDTLAEKLNQQFLEELKISHMLKSYINQSDEKTISFSIRVILPRCLQVKEEIINDPNSKVESWIINKITKCGEIIVKIDNLTKAMEMCEIIANAIQLSEFYDFRLFVIDTRGNKRSLENNQIVLQSVPADKNIFPNQSLKIFTLFDEPYRLEFCKYIFFPQTIESYLYKQDETRLKLLVEGFLTEVKHAHLTPKRVINWQGTVIFWIRKLWTPLFYLILENHKQIQLGLQSFVFLNQNLVRKQMESIYPEIKTLAAQNEELCIQQQLDLKQQQIFTNIQNLARISMINLAYQIPLWGIVTFYVGIKVTEETNKILKSILQNELPNLYLGISYNKFQLLTPGRKKMLCSTKLAQITNITVEPIYIYIQIKNFLQENDNQNIVLKFKTIEGYKISTLIKEYQNLNQQYPQLSQII